MGKKLMRNGRFNDNLFFSYLRERLNEPEQRKKLGLTRELISDMGNFHLNIYLANKGKVRIKKANNFEGFKYVLKNRKLISAYNKYDETNFFRYMSDSLIGRKVVEPEDFPLFTRRRNPERRLKQVFDNFKEFYEEFREK